MPVLEVTVKSVAYDCFVASPSPRTDRQERRRFWARRELAEAAVPLFEAYGFAGTTVGAIADAAGVSESTFFRLFPRKEDVVFYDLPDRLEQFRAELSAAGKPSWQTIRSVFLSNARGWDADKDKLAIARMQLFHREPALRARYLEIILDWEQAIAETVARERGTDPATDIHAILVGTVACSAFRAAFVARLADDTRGIAGHLEAALDEVASGLTT
jgi:AcrR family transcriptional regulator